MAAMKEKRGVFKGNVRVTALLLVLAIAAVFALKSGDVLTGRVFDAGTENQPPQWTGSTNVFTAVQDAPIVLSLNELFSDPEGQSLTFIASDTENISIDLQDNTLTITPEPGFSGERMISIVASDGEKVTTERVRVSVSGTAPEQSAPAAVLEQPTVQFHTQQADIIVNPSDYSISNITPPKTRVQFKDATVMDTIEQCANISYNFASIDTVNCPQYNKAARITFEGLPIANFRILRDGEPCPSDICQNITFDEGNISFDVTEFSNYSINSSFGTLSTCATLLDDTVLDSDVSGTDTCITFYYGDLSLDCAGHTVTFNTGSGGLDYGVYASTKKNLIVKNCNIKSGSTGGDYAYGVYFNGVNYSTVYNNNITNAGAQNTKEHHGILIGNYQNINVTGNWVNTSGNSSFGISFTGSNPSGVNLRVVNNTILTRATGTGTQNNGLGIVSTANFLSTGNNIILNDSSDSQGMYFGGFSEYGTVENNSIIVQGKSSNNIGISIDQLVKNINFTGNSINANGTTNTHGIDLYYTTGHQFRFTNITTAGTSAHYGIYSFESNATFNKTRIENSRIWAYVYEFNVLSKVLFDNTTFATPYGSINILKNFSMDWSFAEINNSDVNVTLNRSFMRSTRAGIRLLNQSPAIITLNGLGANVGSLRVDYEDDGTYIACPSSVCNLLSSSGGTVVFNVSHFTSFAANTTTNALTCNSCADCTTCTGTQGNTCTLSTDISASSTCITVGNDNVTINCDGKTITFNTGAGGSDYGVTASSRKNLTIANCTIISATNAAGAIPIYLLSTNSSQVFNNILKANGSSAIYLSTAAFYNIISANKVNATDPNGNAGIRLAQASQYNNISANTVITNGTVLGNYGILSEFDCPNNTISDNFIVSGGSQSSNYGIYAQAADHKIINNSINTTGDAQNNGIVLNGCSNSIIANNSIQATGTGNGNYGIYVLNAVQTTFANNNIRVLSNTNSHGIYMSAGANRNIFILNNITTNGTSGYAIYIESGISGSNFSSTIINDTPQWIYTGAGASNNFSNTTFAMPDGSINILPFMQINGSQDITKAKLNISSNKAFLNSTNLTFFNTSAIITLYNVPYTTPKIQVDYNDSGDYVDCPASQCSNLGSHTPGGDYVFNTTHFTTYSSLESGTEITSCPVTINSSYTLTQNLATTGTCITIGNDSMVLNCAGYNISYGTGGASNANGILADTRRNISVINCNIRDTNSGGNYAPAINLTYTNDSTIANNNITTNGTNNNHGIYVINGSRNTIANNSIGAFGTSGYNFGIYLYRASSGNNITGNTIRTNSTDYGTGVRIEIMSSDNSVIFNNISTIAGTGIYSDQNSFRSNITSNTINVFTNTGVVLTDRNGIWIQYADNSTVNNNTIATDHTTSLNVQQSSGLVVTGNNITNLAYALGGTTSIQISTINSSIIANNTVFADSSGGITGLFVSVAAYNRISENTLTTNRTGSIGINMGSNNLLNNITGNNIRITQGKDNEGIGISDSAEANNTYEGNNIEINSTGGTSYGIYLAGGFNSTYARNNINITGNSSNNAGIYIFLFTISSRGNYFIGNNITVNGTTNNYGIAAFSGATNNQFIANKIVVYSNASGIGSLGINLVSSSGNSFTGDTVYTPINNTVGWINSTAGSDNNFTNMTFAMPNGSINIIPRFNLTGVHQILKKNINITDNKAFLNSSNLTFLNTSAIITLYGISYTTPKIQVDYNDSGDYVDCPASQCTNLNYSGNVFVFNTTHFTSYRAAEGGIIITGCPVTINESTTLTQSITSNDTCITIGNDSMVLDCNGYSIRYNANGTDNEYGILAQNRNNVTIRNCNVIDINSTGTYGIGINFSNTTYSSITNSNISTNGTSYVHGISMQNNASYNNISDCKIIPLGAGATSHGIVFYYNATDNNVLRNNISAITGTGIDIALDSSRNSIANNTINGALYSINIDLGSNNSTITNNTLSGGTQNINLNQHSGTAIFGNSLTCSGIGRCILLNTYVNNSIIEYNGITAYGISGSMYGIDDISSSNYNNAILWNNITINASSGYGIRGSGANTTIANNRIVITGGSTNTGLSIAGVARYQHITGNSVLIENITSAYGATVDGNNITMAYNDLRAFGTGPNNIGIFVGNNLAVNNTFVGNNITINGTNSNYGIQMYDNAHNSTYSNNIIRVNGTTFNNYGIYISPIYDTSRIPSNNYLSGNTIYTDGATNSTGIIIVQGINNTFAYTNISTNGAGSFGIYFNNSRGNSFIATQLNNTAQWINSTGVSYNNFTNTTFQMPDGSINFPSIFQLNGSQDITKTKLQITYNWARLNSTNLTALNTTGIITLYGLPYSNPQPMVDYDDDSGYENCLPSQCAELGSYFLGQPYVFNTTHFTTYSTLESGTEITSCPVTINSTYTLTQNLASNDTCITIGNDSMVLDCAGYSIFYNANGTDAEFGIASTGHSNITIKNCNIRDTNSTGNNGFGINFSYGNDSIITNTNITTNGSQFSNGMNIVRDSNRNTITNSTIMTFGINSYGIYLLYNSSGNNITGNTIQTNDSDSYAIYLLNSITDTIIGSNNITAVGSAIVTTTYSSRNNISDNNITSIYTTGSRYGISITNSENNTIKNNIVLAQDANINLAYSTGNIITGNRLTINTTFFTPYVAYWASTNNTLFSNNTLTTVSDGCWLMRINGFNNNNIVSSNTFLSNNITSYSNNGGIVIDGGLNNTFAYNTITGYFGGVGIGFIISSNTNYTHISNNNISMLGASSHIGIKIGSQASNQVSDSQIIENNQITLNATSSQGILVTWLSTNNTFRNNKITTTGANSYGVYIGTSNSSFFNSTTINSSQGWIILFANTMNNFTNTTFMTPNGTISILPLIQLNGSIEINNSKLNITSNRAFLNSTALPFLNTSGIITLYGISYITPKSQVDYNNSENYTDCPASQCTNLSYSGNVFVFNTTHFTSYRAAEGGIIITGCPVTINESATLSQDLASNDTCITIGNNSLVLDCAGYGIRYNANGGDNEYGVASDNFTNIAVRNCNIMDINQSGLNGYAIYFTNISNSTVENNNITTNGTGNNRGIRLQACANNDIINNKIAARGSSSNNYGIYLFDASSGNSITGNNITTNGTNTDVGIYCDYGSNNNTISHNLIETNGTAYNYGIFLTANANNTVSNNIISTKGSTTNNYGIYLYSTASGHNVTNNSITTNGTSDNYGIFLYTNINNNNINNNIITTGGSLNNNIGIYLAVGVSGNNVSNNVVSTTGTTDNYGIRLQLFAENNTFDYNNISTLGTLSYAIKIQSSNYSFFNRTILNNPAQWINVSDTSQNNFTNTTFETPNGSINIPGVFTLNSTKDITKSQLNITANRAFLNSTYLPALNTSAIITLYGISYITPKSQVDYNDSGDYVDCPASQCSNLGTFTPGGPYVFNTTHFTSYQAAEGSIIITGCPITVNVTSALSNNLYSNGTCITVGNNNIEIDCAGHTIVFANNTDGIGITASHKANITIKNCRIMQYNDTLPGVSTTAGMYLTHTNDSKVLNNIVNVSGWITKGITINFDSKNNTAYNNTVESNQSSGIVVAQAHGNNITDNTAIAAGSAIQVASSSENNTLSNNRGISNTSSGISVDASHRNTLINNIGTSDSSEGMSISDGSSNNTMTNGTGISNSGIGILMMGYDNNLTGSTGISGSDTGIYVSALSGGAFINNTAVSSTGFGIRLQYSALNNVFRNTTIITNGTWLTILTTPANAIGINFTNTLFQGLNGTVRIPYRVTVANGTNVSASALNISHNRVFMNTAALPSLNTIGIITLNNIYYTSPLPSVDWADTGSIIHCPSDVCTNLSYSGNVFVFNVTHFTSYSAANDTVIINSTIINSNVTNCTVINSTVINSSKSNCTILNSYIINSTNNNTVIIDTNETNSLDNDTFVDDGIIIDVTKAGSNINNSNITDSTITNCTVINSTVINSNKIDCVIINSYIISSNNTNTTIIGSNETNSTDNNAMVYNSTIIGSIKTNTNVTNSTLIDSNKTDSTIINSYIISSNNTNSTTINSNETNSTDINATVDDSIIIDTTKINTIINGTNVTNSNITNSTLTNCTVINSTIDQIVNSSCTYINYHGQLPTPPPSPGGGSGGGGYGGVRRNLTQPSTGGQNLCVESWVCEEWSRCENEMQSRECVDQYHCNTTTLRPAIERKCTVVAPPIQEQPTGELKPHSTLPAPQPLEFPEEKTLWSGISSITHFTISLFRSYMWPIIFVVLGILLLTGAYIGITRARKHEEGEMPAAEPEEAITITRVTAKQPGADADTGALLDSLKSSGDALAEFEKDMRKLKK